MFKKILSVQLCVIIFCTVFFALNVSAEGNEMKAFYDPCHTLDNVWSYSNLMVVDDVIGNANYNNGGKMIGTEVGNYTPFNIVYKVPEDRSFKSFFVETSMQNLDDNTRAIIAYSEDGEHYTDFPYSWKSGSTPGTGQNNAGWARIYSATVTAPAGVDIKYIKIYHGGAGLNGTYKFYFRKVSLITEKGVISENEVTDELDGESAGMYEISNFDVYNMLNKTDADNVANVPDKFRDSNLLGIKDVSKDAYIIYKAGDNRVFTEFKVQNLEKDTSGAVTVELFASKDGVDYDFITDKSSVVFDRIDSNPDATAGYVGWNTLLERKGTFTVDNGYKYVKLLVSGGRINSAYKVKLSNIVLSTRDISEGCIVGDIYEESFDEEMYNIFEAEKAASNGSSLVIEEDGYVMYKTFTAREFKNIELTSSGSKWRGTLEAVDINENKIIWDKEISQNSLGDAVTVMSEVPDGAAYIKISGSAEYSRIVIEAADAKGAEWTYIDGSPVFSAELSGTVIDVLKSGCTVSFGIPVKNAGSDLQNLKAYVCLFEGDRMEKIEEFDVSAESGERVSATGSMAIENVTDKTYVTVFLWSDLETMTAFGKEQSFGKN